MSNDDVLKQFKAMEAWAISVLQEIDARNFENTIKLLKQINSQGRSLEFRGSGIKQYPQMLPEVKKLKIYVASARAGAQQVITQLEKIIALKKSLKISSEFEAKAKSQLNVAKKYSASVLEQIIQARTIVDNGGPCEIGRIRTLNTQPFFQDLLIEAADGKGYYSDKKNRTEFMNKALVSLTLSKVNLSKKDFSRANLTGIKIIGANLRGTDFSGANLSYAEISETDLSEVHLEEANCDIAKFPKARLEGAFFTKASLNATDLSGASLQRASFKGAKLIATNFRYADLSEATFQGANLTGTYFDYANLTNADFRGVVRIDGMSLVETNLKGVNAEGLTFQLHQLGLARNVREMRGNFIAPK